MKSAPIYLDYNATAPLRPEAIDIVNEIMASPANPSSAHGFGRRAKQHLEAARKTIADAVSAFPDEVIFTATGSEANATALCGVGERRLLVSATEHSSVLRQPGASVVPVRSSGLLDLAALEGMLSPDALVSVMLANNETGVIQPIADIAALCKKHGALLHCDAVQALGKIPVDFGALGADMLSLSAHKCGGPPGAAALIARRGLPLQALIPGGGQEMNRRAGTENVAAIAGFAKAVELFDFSQMEKVRGWMREMEAEISSPRRGGAGRGASVERSLNSCPPPNLPPLGGEIIIGAAAPRLPNTSCIAMPGVSSEVQLMDFDLQGFAVSAGSACSSGRIEPSHVLAAMSVPESEAKCAIRISAGWATTEEEIKRFTVAWKTLAGRLGKNSGILLKTCQN